MKTILVAAIASFSLTAAAFAQDQELPGRVVTKLGEHNVLFLSLKDQVAAAEGRETEPILVPVNEDGTFLFPPSLPTTVSIATTPPCIALEAIFVPALEDPGAEVDLLALAAAGDPNSPEVAKLGGVIRNFTESLRVQLGSIFTLDRTSSTTTQTGPGPSAIVNGNFSGLLKSGALSGALEGIANKAGGVNMGCREQK